MLTYLSSLLRHRLAAVFGYIQITRPTEPMPYPGVFDGSALDLQPPDEDPDAWQTLSPIFIRGSATGKAGEQNGMLKCTVSGCPRHSIRGVYERLTLVGCLLGARPTYRCSGCREFWAVGLTSVLSCIL